MCGLGPQLHASSLPTSSFQRCAAVRTVSSTFFSTAGHRRASSRRPRWISARTSDRARSWGGRDVWSGKDVQDSRPKRRSGRSRKSAANGSDEGGCMQMQYSYAPSPSPRTFGSHVYAVSMHAPHVCLLLASAAAPRTAFPDGSSVAQPRKQLLNIHPSISRSIHPSSIRLLSSVSHTYILASPLCTSAQRPVDSGPIRRQGY
jgi:hypothetical protein